MLQISIASDADKLLSTIGKLRANKLPAALKDAANEMGAVITSIMKREMSESFDRPTPYALRGLNWIRASTDKPFIRIWINEDPNKGIPHDKFLSPEMGGGPRRHKRFENALIAKGIMQPGMYAVPASGAPRDAYGNVSGGFIIRMLSDLRAFHEDEGYRRNRKAGRRTGARRTNYFFYTDGTSKTRHLRPGIYWHANALLVPVFMFTRAPQYQVRYPFYDVGKRVYDRYSKQIIAKHMKAALA